MIIISNILDERGLELYTEKILGLLKTPRKLESIAITTPPNKTSYKSGERFDPTGMIVTGSYDLGVEVAITRYQYSPHILTDGVTEVVITYTESGVTKTASLPVTVDKVLLSFELISAPNKRSYRYLETLNENGLIVEASYTDGSVVQNADYTISPSIFDALGDQEVTVSHTYGDVTKSVSFVVNVLPITIQTPSQSGTLTYNGNVQVPSWIRYDFATMSMGGVTSATNAGTYTATFTSSYGYVFSDGTSIASVQWSIGKATLSAVPSQNGSLTYNGNAQLPSWDANYIASAMTLFAEAQTNAGNYVASFTPTSNYKWWDGTTDPKTVSWTIGRAPISVVPSQTGTLTYSGSAQSPSWANYDAAKMTLSAVPQTNAGTHMASFTPTANYMWSDGSITAKEVSWIIDRATIATIPSQTGTLTYNGNTQSPSWANYDASKMTLSITPQVNAGTHTASFTPTSNYKWSDGLTGAKSVNWTIGKASYTPSASATSVALDTSNPNATVTVIRQGDGVISAISSDTSVAAIGTINQSTGAVQINNVNKNGGSATVTINIAAGTNYNAASLTVTVTAKFTTIYGVFWDWDNNESTKGVRTDAAAGFSDPSPVVSDSVGSSPFDDLMPWAGMVKETRPAGVLVKEPKYWFKWSRYGTKGLKLQIADGPVEGFHVDPVNMDHGDGLGELDFSYIGRYRCIYNYTSNTSEIATSGITMSEARTNIHALGDNIWQIDFAQFWYVNMLYLVEFADWDGQRRIGRGGSDSSYNRRNGQTDAMQYHTGTMRTSPDSFGPIQYRNIEGWWSSMYEWLDGCCFFGTSIQNILGIELNPKRWGVTSDYYVRVGTLPSPSDSNYYPTGMGIPTAEGYTWGLYPSEYNNGYSSRFVPDYWMTTSDGYSLRHGGSDNNLQNGPFAIRPANASTKNTNIGCRLQERPPKT